MNEEGEGYPIYRMNEISNMLCNTVVLKCAQLTSDEASPYILEENDVLFNRTNSQDFVGRTGIFKKFSETPYVFASYLIRLRTNESEVLPEYLTAFLNSKYGVWDIKRRARISINQSNVNAEEVKASVLPVLDMGFQRKLREIFNKAHSLREESKLLYTEAEGFLMHTLGLRSFVPSSGNAAVKSFRESFLQTGRLDAEYFHPEKSGMLDWLSKFQGSHIGNYVSSINDTLDPAKDLSVGLVSNFDLTDALEIYLEDNELVPFSELGSVKKVMKKGDVVISRLRSYLKEVAVVDTSKERNVVGSSEFIVLRKKGEDISAESLLVYLRSLPVQIILKWCQSGSNHPRFMEEDLLAIKVPEIILTIQKTLQINVRSAINKSREAKQLLETAKRAVEIAIEENEKAALEFINSI